MPAKVKGESKVKSQKSKVKSTSSRDLCATIVFCLLVSGCNRYADFALPAPPPSQTTATSFDWKPDPAPALSPGDWDSVDVLNPSVVHLSSVFYNFYSGFDG